MTRRRRAPAGELDEQQWQAQVVGLATFYGWRIYHTHDSRRSPAGFPDLVMVRGPELIFAELKGPRTRVTKEQEDWLAELSVVADGVAAAKGPAVSLGGEPVPAVDVYLWRAPDLEPVHERLARGRFRHERAG